MKVKTHEGFDTWDVQDAELLPVLEDPEQPANVPLLSDLNHQVKLLLRQLLFKLRGESVTYCAVSGWCVARD